MKSKLFILLLFVNSLLFGQSVDNSTTFTLQDVIDAVNPSSNDLNECFNDANPDYFNDTYKAQYYAEFGNLNNLLMFRDYGAHNATTVVVPTVITTTPSSVSYRSAVVGGDVTSDGGSTLLTRGVYISTNSNMSGATAFPIMGQTGVYSGSLKLDCTGTTYYVQAYASNSAGFGTGDIVSFVSSSPTLVQIEFFSQLDGVTITDVNTAYTAANKLYWGITGATTSSLRYVVSMTTDEPVYMTGTNPSCRTMASSWRVAKNASNGNVYVVNTSINSEMTTCNQYTANVVTYTTSGTWTRPSNVAYAKIECWGGGGTGGGATGTGARAAGGSGGTYASKVIAVPNASYAYVVGALRTASATAVRNGNPTSFGTTLVIATGGIGGAVNATTGGATATTASTTGSVGDVIYAGGNGGAGTSATYSGGGGGGAGSSGAGGNASNQTAGTGTSQNGGNGAAGRNTAGAGAAGSNYGGGGAGGCATTSTDRAGGSGAAGYLRITY